MPDKNKVRSRLDTIARLDERLDEALKQTFPASDAVAIDIERGSQEREVSSRLPPPAR
jgi:hypothetical protein